DPDLQRHREDELEVSVLVVPAPPLVGLRLRVPGRRVLPLLLPSERGQVEESPHAAERLDAAMGREVRAEDVVAVVNEDAETERLAVLVDALLGCLGPDAEVEVEVALEGRMPRDRPAHSLPVVRDLRNRSPGDEHEGRVACVQVGEVADLVDEHRAAVATHILIRPEHEVVEKQLPATFEEIEQPSLARGPVEDVVLIDVHPREPATLGGKIVARARGLLLLDEQRVPRRLPLHRGNDWWKIHGFLSSGGSDPHDPISIGGEPPPGWVSPGTLAG